MNSLKYHIFKNDHDKKLKMADVHSPVAVTEFFQDGNLFMKLQTAHQSWNSEDHVQSWINNNLTAETQLVKEEDDIVTFKKQESTDSDVFLQLPGHHGDNEDDLELGAEAKYYGCSNQSLISPRLSPIGSFDERELELNDESYNCEGKAMVCDPVNSPALSESDLKALLASKSTVLDLVIHDDVSEHESEVEDFMERKHSRIEKGHSVESCSTYDSFTSSIDRPSSLAAAMRTDPEELLYNLGFVSNFSLLQSIPSRFFEQPSAARGIDVDDIHQSLLWKDEDDDEQFDQETESNPIFHPRFSQSSIDLSSNMSTDSKRLLFQSSHSDLPSIYLSQDDDRPNTPTTTSGSLTTNFMKLATLEEVPEPASRSNSFDSERKTSFSETMTSLADRLHILVSRKSPEESVKRSNSTESISRKYSDASCSRVDTLTDENVEDEKQLNLPVFKREVLSSKSSINTVIENVMATSANFQPIENNQLDQTETSHSNESTKLKRMLFRTSRSECVESDYYNSSEVNVFESQDNVTSIVINTDNDVTSENILPHEELILLVEPSIETLTNENQPVLVSPNRKSSVKFPAHETSHTLIHTNKTINESFKDFFRRLKKQPSNEEITKKLNVQIVLTPPDKTYSESLFLTLDDEGNEFQTNSIDSSYKKGYILSAISALTNILGKTDNKEEPTTIKHGKNNTDVIIDCNSAYEKKENINTFENTSKELSKEVSNDDIDNNKHEPIPDLPNPLDIKKVPIKLFTLFNHQTLATHTHSAFTSIGTNKTNEKEHTNKQVKTKLNNIKKEKIRKISTERQTCAVTSQGYVADDAMTSDESLSCRCDCPSATKPKRKRNTKRNIKISSVESSGFEEDTTATIACPLGKNCTIDHSKYYDETEKKGLRQQRSKSFPNTNSSVVLKHEHFGFMMQQISSLRSEMKLEFETERRRQDHLFSRLLKKEQLVNAGNVENNSNLSDEVKILRSMLQEKDDEIIHLRETVKNLKQK